MNWYVVYTKPKWEKKVADRLQEIGITVYCPMVTQMRQWSDRKKKVTVPLFPSYLFIQIEDKNRAAVFEVTGVIRYLFWLRKPAIVKPAEIESIKQWLLAPDTFEVTLSAWKPGDKIVVEEGAFKNQVAIVQEVKKNSYVLVLEALGCVLRVDRKGE